MSAKTIEARVRHALGSPDIPIIDLRGDIDALAEEALKAAYAKANHRKPTAILLNFSGVEYINSTGIALIVGLLAQARTAGCRLLMCGLSDHYVEIFRITRLADFASVFPDEVSALAAVPVSV